MNKRMERSLALGHMDRRGFMTAALAAGVSLSAASLMAGEALAAKPKKGGKLRVGYGAGATSDSMDPATYSNDIMYAIGYAVFSSLVELGPDGTAKPDLAESFEATPDAKIWTFHIRDGVRFSDGKTVSARDVVATISYHMGDNSKSGIKPLLAQIAEMKAQGDNMVVFTLKEGNADFPYIFFDFHLGIRPARADGSIDPMTMIGSGGYTVEKFEPGVRAVLKRRDDYWKPGRAHFDSVELIAIQDPAARMNALVTDEVDLIDRVDLKTIHFLKRNKNIKIHTQNGTLHYVMAMQTDVAPFNDNNVRMALKHSINREEILSKVFRGYGVVGNDQPLVPSMSFYNASIKPHSYDPDKARSYLKKSGLTSLDVELHAADAAFAGAVDAGLLFSESAKAAGINIKVVREPNDGYWSNVWLKKPFFIGYWGGRPTADMMFSAAYAAGAEWNESHFNNPRFDELLVKARCELDQAKRGKVYGEMQTLIAEEGGTIVPVFGQYVSAMNKRVQMPDAVTQIWDLDSVRFIERWWMA